MPKKEIFTAADAVKSGLVPAAPIGRVIRDWEQRQWQKEVMYMGGQGGTDVAWHPVRILSEWTGIHVDTIRKVREGQKDWIEFDNADLLLCAMHVPWRSDPELREIYENFDFSWLDLSKPTCDDLAAFDGLSNRLTAALFGVRAHTIRRQRERAVA